eukprot:9259197-Prorocentrum_lima.AAC.1
MEWLWAGRGAHLISATWPPTAEESYVEGLMQLAAGDKSTREHLGKFQDVYDKIQELAATSPEGIMQMMTAATKGVGAHHPV